MLKLISLPSKSLNKTDLMLFLRTLTPIQFDMYFGCPERVLFLSVMEEDKDFDLENYTKEVDFVTQILDAAIQHRKRAGSVDSGLDLSFSLNSKPDPSWPWALYTHISADTLPVFSRHVVSHKPIMKIFSECLSLAQLHSGLEFDAFAAQKTSDILQNIMELLMSAFIEKKLEVMGCVKHLAETSQFFIKVHLILGSKSSDVLCHQTDVSYPLLYEIHQSFPGLSLSGLGAAIEKTYVPIDVKYLKLLMKDFKSTTAGIREFLAEK